MASSDFWHDIAAEFRALHGGYALRGDWDRTVNSGRPLRWSLAGGGPGTHSQFEAMARRAASEMPNPKYSDLLLSWLEALLERSRDMSGANYYVEKHADGSEGPHHVVGSIHGLCEASAVYCDELESAARQQEFEKKQRSNPRNWSPLRANFEAFRAIKSLQAQPHERIPESLVRETIANQLGIKSEEVTWKQIQFEVAGLLREYPAITVVPTELAPSQRSPENTPTVGSAPEIPCAKPDETAPQSHPIVEQRTETVADQLKRLRDECRWTISDLAEATGLSDRQIARHLSGEFKPLPRNISSYERAFSKQLKRQVVIKKMS